MKTFIPIICVLITQYAVAQLSSDSLKSGTTFLRFNVTNLADISEPNISC